MTKFRITLHDEGEGWFPEYANRSLSGTVEQNIPSNDRLGNCYLLLFDHILELQERGFATPLAGLPDSHLEFSGLSGC